jgi:hypothetical protein
VEASEKSSQKHLETQVVMHLGAGNEYIIIYSS